jgi:hypothetical protein
MEQQHATGGCNSSRLITLCDVVCTCNVTGPRSVRFYTNLRHCSPRRRRSGRRSRSEARCSPRSRRWWRACRHSPCCSLSEKQEEQRL